MPSLIREMKRNNINYGFKTMNELLVKGVGIPKSTASEILRVSRYRDYYNSDDSIKPEWKDFGIKSLVGLARLCESDYSELEDLRKQNIIEPNMSYKEIEKKIIDIRRQRCLQYYDASVKR